ncbi:Ro-like RNA binding protein [Gordonia phage Trax]|nr:RNA-binding protein [Gordonia phage Trax]QDM55981.1 Ro-like RNA binding protein [Gordonia phage Trax]
MSRYNTATKARPAQKSSAIKAGTKPKTNPQGGIGFKRGDAKSELFLSAATSFMQPKFYETESDLRARQRKLIAKVAVSDPEWTFEFLTWLRTEGNLRTGSLTLAADAVRERLKAGKTGWNRQIISTVLRRPDEPGEMLAYWTTNYGRNVPISVKRGIADVIEGQYNERNFLKYDSASRAFRFGDVIELTHPKMTGSRGDLASYAITVGKGHDAEIPSSLSMIRKNRNLRQWTPGEIVERAKYRGDDLMPLSDVLSAAGMTWEDIPALVNGPWTPELWEAAIPNMGVMALMRNLRNFDQVGISKQAAKMVRDKLSDPEAVRKSRILPLRALSAYKAVSNSRWHGALEDAVDITLDNVPALKGRTLILVDCSGSMFFGNGTDLSYAESAAVFGTALAAKAEKATLVHYGSSSREVPVPRGASVLEMARSVHSMGGTATAAAIQQHYNGHDRVILLTDEQHNGGGYGWGSRYVSQNPSDYVPKHIPLITFNLAGYKLGGVKDGPNRLTFSSLSDSAWKLVDMFGNGMSGWPWEAN